MSRDCFERDWILETLIAHGMQAANNTRMAPPRTPAPALSRFPRLCRLLGSLALASTTLAATGCDDAHGAHKQAVHLRPAQVVPTKEAAKFVTDPGPNPADTRVRVGDILEARAKKSGGKVGQEDWVAKEHASGMSKWRDVGVYVDGMPVGFMTFGEMPIKCKTTWLKEKVSADMRYGMNDPGWKWARKRIFLFSDYLKSLDIDVRKVKEIHVYGPKPTETLIVQGKDIGNPEFYFSYGANVSGKPIPHAPENFGNRKIGDKIGSVMVYMKKKPPILVRDVGMVLDGEAQDGVPYYGEPVRGGIRIYLDDKLVTTIKRQDLDPKKATKGPDGELEWKLAEFLSDHGVDTKKVVELYAIREDQRQEKIPGSEIATIKFEATTQGRGGILLGKDDIRAEVLAMHTREIKPDEMPPPLQDDE